MQWKYIALLYIPVHFRGRLGVDAVGGDGRAVSVEHLLSVFEVDLALRNFLEPLAKFSKCIVNPVQ